MTRRQERSCRERWLLHVEVMYALIRRKSDEKVSSTRDDCHVLLQRYTDPRTKLAFAAFTPPPSFALGHLLLLVFLLRFVVGSLVRRDGCNRWLVRDWYDVPVLSLNDAVALSTFLLIGRTANVYDVSKIINIDSIIYDLRDSPVLTRWSKKRKFWGTGFLGQPVFPTIFYVRCNPRKCPRTTITSN